MKRFQVSVLGRPDHHVLVVLLASLLLLYLMKLGTAQRRGQTAFYAIAAGLMLFLLLLTWVGALYFVVAVVACVGVSSLSRYHLELLAACAVAILLEGIVLDALQQRRLGNCYVRCHVIAGLAIATVAGLSLWRGVMALLRNTALWPHGR